MRSFSIRPVRPSDLDALIKLYIGCFGEPPWCEEFTYEEVKADFEMMLGWPETLFVVAENETGKVIGSGIGFHVCRKADVWKLLPDSLSRQSFYVAELFVDASERAHGVCRTLVEHLILLAREAKFPSLSVRTSVDQQVIRRLFVSRLGLSEVAFEEVMSRKIVSGMSVDAPDTRVIMAGDIHPPTNIQARGCLSGY